VSAPGYVTQTVSLSSFGSTVAVALLGVNQSTTFSGALQDQSGAPLAGFTVSVNTSGYGSQGAYTATTGPDGSFSVDAPPGHYYVDVSGTEPGDPDRVEVATATPVDLTSNLEGQTLTIPFATVGVDVQNSLGLPVSGVTVTTSGGDSCSNAGFDLLPGAPANELSPTTISGTTDLLGDATVTLPDCQTFNGAMKVFLQPPSGSGYAEQYATGPTSLTGSTSIPVTLASLSGSLVDAAGNPLQGQSVAILNSSGSPLASTRTTGSGDFALTVPPGTYAVATSGDLGDPTTYSVTVPNVNLTAGKSGVFALPTETVDVDVSAAGGGAVAGASVALACTVTTFALLGGTASGKECGSEVTTGSGTATIEMLPAAAATITITPPAGAGLLPFFESVVPSNGLVVRGVLPEGLHVATTALPSGTVKVRCATTLAGAGGNAPYKWSLATSSGPLPLGLRLSSKGIISGNPRVAGRYTFTVHMVDKKVKGVSQGVATKVLTIVVAPRH